MVDVKLCCRDKFVVRGDATPDDFAQEVENMKNFLIDSEQDKQSRNQSGLESALEE